jgi:hypothetical protein
LDKFDAGDAAVGALGVAVVARAAYALLSAASVTPAVSSSRLSWSLLGWLPMLQNKRT